MIQLLVTYPDGSEVCAEEWRNRKQAGHALFYTVGPNLRIAMADGTITGYRLESKQGYTVEQIIDEFTATVKPRRSYAPRNIFGQPMAYRRPWERYAR